MNTYLIKIEISEYVKDDQGFYVVFGEGQSAKGLIELADSLDVIMNDALRYIKERLK